LLIRLIHLSAHTALDELSIFRVTPRLAVTQTRLREYGRADMSLSAAGRGG